MGLPQARGLFMRYKSFLCLTVAVLAFLIGPALFYYNHGIVESKSAVIGNGKDKRKKKKYDFLTGTVPELKECAGKKGKKGTINIEGLACLVPEFTD